MLGSPCSPCCSGTGCSNDGKPITDPKDEGTWIPSGEWPDVTWEYQANPGDASGNTWYFFGSPETSGDPPFVSVEAQESIFNLCNWYSHIEGGPAVAPRDFLGPPPAEPEPGSTLAEYRAEMRARLTRRANRLPPPGAIIHFYSNASSGVVVHTQLVNHAYLWGAARIGERITMVGQSAAHGTTFSFVLAGPFSIRDEILVGFSTPRNSGTLRGGALFIRSFNGRISSSHSFPRVFDGATFRQSFNDGSVSGSATRAVRFEAGGNYGFASVNNALPAVFVNSSTNRGYVTGNAEFYESRTTGEVDGNAWFYSYQESKIQSGVIEGNAFFYGENIVRSIVHGIATFFDTSSRSNEWFTLQSPVFNDFSVNLGPVLNATFNDQSTNNGSAGGSVFNDSSRNIHQSNNGFPATFNDSSSNAGHISSGTFNNTSFNDLGGYVVNAIFNDEACSKRVFQYYSAPAYFGTSETPPTCNGSAPTYANRGSADCGCG